MGHMISITLTQGTNLLRILHIPAFKVSSAVGERKFCESAVSQCNKRMRMFYKILRKNSPLLIDDDKIVFGPKEAYDTWERKPTKAEIESGENPDKLLMQYDVRNIKQTVDLDMTGKERDGLYWALFLLTHPGSPLGQGASTQEMLVWPLAEQIHMTGQLEEDCCLKKGEIVELVDDVERAKKEADEEEKAKKVKEATPPSDKA